MGDDVFGLSQILSAFPPDFTKRSIQDATVICVILTAARLGWFFLWRGHNSPGFHATEIVRFAEEKPDLLIKISHERAKHRKLRALLDLMHRELKIRSSLDELRDDEDESTTVETIRRNVEVTTAQTTTLPSPTLPETTARKKPRFSEIK